MTKNNIYSPKENYKQIEEVSYLEKKEAITPEEQAKVIDKLVKNEIPSYEEFMKTYQEDEGAAGSYYYEIDGYGDIRVVKCYGPGFFGDLLDASLFVGKTVAIGSAATAITVATGGAAIPIGASMWVGGKAVEKIGEETDCRILQSIGETVGDLGLGTATAGIFTGAGAVRCAAKYGLEVWQVEKIGKIYGYLGHAETTLIMERHYKHKNQGIGYDRNCKVCNMI